MEIVLHISHRYMQRALLLILLGVILVACEDPSGPGGSNNPASTAITMTQLTDLPKTGGDVTGVVIKPDNTIIAAIDGKLYSMSASGGSMQLINGDAKHSTIALAPSGELYTLTETNFRTYDLATGTHRDVPIDPAGPFALGRRIEESEIIFSPSGEPYVRIINNTPQTFVYYSADKGVTWQSLPLPPGFQYDGGLAFAPNGDMLMSSTFGFYRSGNRGATWTTQPPPRSGYGGRLHVAVNGDIYHYPRGGGGLKVSKNGGASFTELTPFNQNPYFVDVIQGTDGALYGLAHPRLLRSTDGGVTWNHVVFARGSDLDMRGSTIAVGLVGMANGMSDGYGGIVISQDGGTSWASTGTKSVEQISDIALDKDGNLMILADAGLYRRTNGGWRTFGTNPNAFQRFASTPQGGLLLANTWGVYHSSDNGASWKESLISDFIGGIDPPVVPILLGRRNGEFLLSLTGYSDARRYSNGHLYRIGADGVPVPLKGLPYSFSNMVEDRNGALRASEEYTTFGGTIQLRFYESSDGATWTQEPANGTFTPIAIAHNNQNRAFTIGPGIDDPYKLRTPGSDQITVLTLDGYTSEPHYIERGMFGPDDRLYLFTILNQVFMSSGPVR